MTTRPQPRLALAVGNSTVKLSLAFGTEVGPNDSIGLVGLTRGRKRESFLSELQWLREQVGEFEPPSIAVSVNPSGYREVGTLLKAARVPRPLLAGKDFPIPMKMAVDAPEKVGADRLLGALAAYRRTRRACVVVDCGTAITVNSVSKRGVFLGGAILPGLHVMAKSLALSTALLPEITFQEKVSPIGKNTEDAIAAGVILGAAGAIVRLVGEARRVIGRDAPVFLTGGGAHGQVRNYLPHGRLEYEWVPWLVLEGLALAYQAWRKR